MKDRIRGGGVSHISRGLRVLRASPADFLTEKIMDKYNEALERAKKWEREHPHGYVIKDMMEYIFPGLREPELTEFEESLRQVIVSALSGETPNGSGGTMSWAVALSDSDVRKLAPRLLELAKKEICKGCTVGLDQYWKGREDARKENANSYTFHYPTYQPPCFHGGVCTNPMRDCINCPMHSSSATTNTTSGTCKKD